MRFKRFRAQQMLGVLAIVAGAIVAFLALGADAQAPGVRELSPASLIGVEVFSADGTKVGTVSAVSVGPDEQITEIRLTTASPLGLGARTVAIKQGDFMTLDGAVVLDMSAAEVDALPTERALRQGAPA